MTTIIAAIISAVATLIAVYLGIKRREKKSLLAPPEDVHKWLEERETKKIDSRRKGFGQFDGTIRIVARLRSEPIIGLDKKAIEKMVLENDFFDADWNPIGLGIPHEYRESETGGIILVVDLATELMWGKIQPTELFDIRSATNYIERLNQERYAGYKDWRLPTVEEAKSLVEQRKHGELYTDPIFCDGKKWIWTADKENPSLTWTVNYFLGNCISFPSAVNDVYVRAVRHAEIV